MEDMAIWFFAGVLFGVLLSWSSRERGKTEADLILSMARKLDSLKKTSVPPETVSEFDQIDALIEHLEDIKSEKLKGKQ